MSKSQILLVEDNESLGYILKEYLEMHNFEVYWAKNGVEGWELIEAVTFQLCIIDIMMPEMDGFTLGEKIKEKGYKMPFVFLTARSMKIDQLKGFKLGADDYIVKPIDEEVLLSKIKAILKRTERTFEEEEKLYQIGQFHFDPKNHYLKHGGKTIHITVKESLVLQTLCNKKQELVNREDVLKKIWGRNDYFNRRSMDVHIARLRKHLSADPNVQIMNVRGKGYMLTDEK